MSMILKRNLELKKVKMESTDDALKRGIKVQTSFISKAEMKKKCLVEKNTATKYVNEEDQNNAEQFRLLKIMGF